MKNYHHEIIDLHLNVKMGDVFAITEQRWPFFIAEKQWLT